jgi:hypothetical protein
VSSEQCGVSRETEQRPTLKKTEGVAPRSCLTLYIWVARLPEADQSGNIEVGVGDYDGKRATGAGIVERQGQEHE